MPNPFVHIELMSNDVGKAKTFYGKLLDWKLEDMDMGDMTYTMIKVGEGTGGGLMKNPMPGGHSIWVAYVEVDDREEYATIGVQLGERYASSIIAEDPQVTGRDIGIVDDDMVVVAAPDPRFASRDTNAGDDLAMARQNLEPDHRVTCHGAACHRVTCTAPRKRLPSAIASS